MDETYLCALSEEYIARINKVQDYIENNLSEEMSLQKLSNIAAFSAFHFHRIFYSMTGETLFQYIQRVRLEKAVRLLVSNTGMSVSSIALECGFANQASFAKTFKKRYGINAAKLRKCMSSGDLSESNLGKVFPDLACYNTSMNDRQAVGSFGSGGHVPSEINYHVEVRDIPDLKVIYVRHTGKYKQDAALFETLFAKLYQFADANGLIHATKSRWLTLYHDTPEITDGNRLRISVCMTGAEDVATRGEIGSMVVQGGTYAIGHFTLGDDQYQAAWDAMFAGWLPRSSFQPDDRLCFELYPEDGTNDTSDKAKRVDIYIPVKPL